MTIPPPSGFVTLDAVASWARRVAQAVGVAWNVQHRADGSHVFSWVRVPFTVAGYTGWTATTQTLLKYQVVDHTMTVAFDVTGTATAIAALSMTIPGDYSAKESVSAGMFAYSDAGTPGTGDCIATGRRLDFYKNINATAWTVGTARVQGTVSFEVQ